MEAMEGRGHYHQYAFSYGSDMETCVLKLDYQVGIQR